MSELGPHPNSRFLLTPKVFIKLGYCFVKEYNVLDRLKPDSQVSSVQSLSCVRLFATPWTAAGHASLSIPTAGIYSNSCPLSRWYHPTISSVVSFSSCLQSFPASGSFPMSQFFASGRQSIGVSALASVFPVNIQGGFPLGLTGWIFLQSRLLLFSQKCVIMF